MTTQYTQAKYKKKPKKTKPSKQIKQQQQQQQNSAFVFKLRQVCTQSFQVQGSFIAPSLFDVQSIPRMFETTKRARAKRALRV